MIETKQSSIASPRDLWNLIASNFFFVAAYVLLGSNALFLIDDLSDSGRHWIILGMSAFATFQVGGTWFLSLISPSIESSSLFLLVLRLGAIGLMAYGRPLSIFISLALFGLSHSVFYKISRRLMSELIKVDYQMFGRGYFYFGVSTNLAFILFSSLGAGLIKQSMQFSAGTIFAAVFLGISFVLLKKAPPTDSPKLNYVDKPKVSADTKNLILDTIRFAAFLFPYSVINAAIAQKVKAAGLPSSYNAFLISLNSLVIIGLQVFGLRLQNLFRFSIRRYDWVSVTATGLLILGFFSNVWLFVPIVILYSACEAYQLPNIEHLLFTTRTYENRIINRFLLMDSLVCFLGPWIGALSIWFNFGSRFDAEIKDMIDTLVNLV